MSSVNKLAEHTCERCPKKGILCCEGCDSYWYCSEQCKKVHLYSGHHGQCKIMNMSQIPYHLKIQDAEILKKMSNVPSTTLFNNKRLSFILSFVPKIMNDDAVGCGLKNIGNTCYLNSVLQCLTYTTPIQLFLRGQDHTKENCSVEDGKFCMICELKECITLMTNGEYMWIVPKNILLNIKKICPYFELGNQEDAHELFISIVNLMNDSFLLGKKSILSKFKNVEERMSVEETSIISEVFGGKFLSKMRCTECGNVTASSESFIDISLDLSDHAKSLEEAFHNFTKIEVINKSASYKCERCNRVVNIHKQMSIWKPPEILCIHLKRFDILKGGSKINKSVVYGETLNLNNYISPESPYNDGSSTYELYGIITHYGSTIFSGHYVAFIKLENQWFLFDDEKVLHIERSIVMKQNAYILLYRKIKKDKSKTTEQNLRSSNKLVKSMESISLQNSTNSIGSTGDNLISRHEINNLAITHIIPPYDVYENENNGVLENFKVKIDVGDDDPSSIEVIVSPNGNIIFFSAQYYLNLQTPFEIDTINTKAEYFTQNHTLVITLSLKKDECEQQNLKIEIIENVILDDIHKFNEENRLEGVEPQLEIVYKGELTEIEEKFLKGLETIEKLNIETTTYQELYKNIKELNRSKIRKNTNQLAPQQPKVATKKIGRNETCPCGSGKKYKKCHGA